MNTAQMKAVLYCRVSTKEQVDEGNSLITQERVCREYAYKNGYHVEEVFIEQGESAKTANRPELNKMLDYCSHKRNGITAIITYKIDRISRNTDDYSQIRILLKRYGVEIKSTSEQFEDTPVGRFLENTLASIAEFDNSIRTERSVNGMREAVIEGRYVWMAPVGYTNVRVGGKATIAPSNQAPLIKEMFETLAMGILPADEVRKRMYAKGLMNVHGKPLTKSYFFRLIKNKLYAGIIEKFGESHKGVFEPIISEDLFHQVQNVLLHKKKSILFRKWDHEDFPLRRFIRHPDGNKLRGGWCKGKMGKRYAFYWYEGIPGMNFKKEIIEKYFQQLFNQCSLQNPDASQFFRFIKEEYILSTKEKAKRAERLNRRLIEIQEKENQLVDKNIKGIIPDSVVQKQLSLLKEEENAIRLELHTPELNMKNMEPVFKTARLFLKNPYKFWLNANSAERIKLQEFTFPKGVIFDGKNMRTPEISVIFKTKEEILPPQSSLVPSRFTDVNAYVVECIRLWDILHPQTQSLRKQSDPLFNLF